MMSPMKAHLTQHGHEFRPNLIVAVAIGFRLARVEHHAEGHLFHAPRVLVPPPTAGIADEG